MFYFFAPGGFGINGLSLEPCGAPDGAALPPLRLYTNCSPLEIPSKALLKMSSSNSFTY